MYNNYTNLDGLPSAETYQIIQDSKGFIWIASDLGISKYNGYDFKNFDLTDNLPNVSVFELFEDNKHRIWCITSTGELAIIENDKITPYLYNDTIVKYKSKKYYPIKKSFYADSLNNIYISFENSPIWHISPNGVLDTLEQEAFNNGYMAIKYLNQNNVLFSSITGDWNKKVLLKIRNNNNRLLNVEPLNLNYRVGNRSIAVSYFNKTLYAVKNNLVEIDSTGKPKVYDLKKTIIWASIDHKGLLWIGFVNGGIMAFEKDDLNKEIIHLLPKRSVSSMLHDKDGAYWFSTLNNGIFHFPMLNMKVYSEKTGLSTSIINHVAKVDNNIWFAGRSNKFYKYTDGNIKQFTVNFPGIYECRCLKSIGKDSLFISYFGPRNNITQIRNEDKTILSTPKSFLCHAFKDKEGNLYGTLNNIVPFVNDSLGKGYFTNKFSRIYDTEFLNEKEVLLGTSYGIFLFHIQTKEYKKLEDTVLQQTRINCLYKDKWDNIWVGSKGKGLYVITPNSTQHFNLNHHHIGNSVNEIERSGDTLWLATSNGIARATISREADSIQVKQLIKIPWLFNNEINSLCLHNNKVFAGTRDGLIEFYQNYSPLTPNSYFTEIKINGKKTDIQNSYSLKNKENNLEISFVSLNYVNANQTRYLYKLEGTDLNWNSTTNRSVRYHTLEPGNYTFFLKAINNQGIESEEAKSIEFTINPSYYQTIWFKFLVSFGVILLISGIIISIYTIKLRENKKKSAFLVNMNKYRQQALSAQMNPHFIHNSLNSIQSYILRNERETSSEYLALFSQLMRQVLENSRNPFISLNKELEALELYIKLENIRFKNSIQYTFTIDKTMNCIEISVPPLILQPFVENAIHHGLRNKEGDKKLSIHIINEVEAILITIKDNGIGREKAFEIKKRKTNTYKSLGTEITSKRIELFKNLYKKQVEVKTIDLYDKHSSPTGTLIELKMCKNFVPVSIQNN